MSFRALRTSQLGMVTGKGQIRTWLKKSGPKYVAVAAEESVMQDRRPSYPNVAHFETHLKSGYGSCVHVNGLHCLPLFCKWDVGRGKEWHANQEQLRSIAVKDDIDQTISETNNARTKVYLTPYPHTIQHRTNATSYPNKFVRTTGSAPPARKTRARRSEDEESRALRYPRSISAL